MMNKWPWGEKEITCRDGKAWEGSWVRNCLSSTWDSVSRAELAQTSPHWSFVTSSAAEWHKWGWSR